VNKKALLISWLAAILGVALGHLYLRRLEHELSGGPKIAVLTAAVDLAPGSVLEQTQLGVRPIPQAYVGERNILERDAHQVVGVRLSTSVRASEPILWSDVATLAAPGRDLSSSVQEGKRAIALSGNAVTFDGLLRPGDRVDLLFTRAGGDETSTLLQNLLVLAVGGRLEASDDRTPGRSLRGSVSLSVSSEEGQLITQAEQQGNLTLVLRNPDDIAIVMGLPKTERADLIPRSLPMQHGETHANRAEIERVR
jgi:pilus assembly protein CpaB